MNHSYKENKRWPILKEPLPTLCYWWSEKYVFVSSILLTKLNLAQWKVIENSKESLSQYLRLEVLIQLTSLRGLSSVRWEAARRHGVTGDYRWKESQSLHEKIPITAPEQTIMVREVVKIDLCRFVIIIKPHPDIVSTPVILLRIEGCESYVLTPSKNWWLTVSSTYPDPKRYG